MVVELFLDLLYRMCLKFDEVNSNANVIAYNRVRQKKIILLQFSKYSTKNFSTATVKI